MRPFFTVIIPTLNSELTIGKAAGSVLSQEYQDFETLIIDGASSDGTRAVVKGLNDERITFISEPDQGIYDAMNKGVKLARGQWLYFLGSDDYLWDKNVFEDVFKFVQSSKADFIYGNVFSPDLGDDYDGVFDIKKLYKQNICHQAVFCKRMVFETVGSFDVNYTVLGDHDFTIRCFQEKDIRKSHFERRIAYYAPSGASRGVDKIRLIRDRYLLASTLSRYDANPGWMEVLYERQAKHLLGVLGARNFLLGKAKATIQSFSAYDRTLRRRMLRAIWNRMLNRIKG